jgi:putative SOS response-associated peptidase YedK
MAEKMRSSFSSWSAILLCLIPADGFYEWQLRPGGKQPYRILAKKGGPLTFAGLWER